MILDAIVGLGGKLIDKLIPDPVARDAAKLDLLKLQQSGELAAMLAQTEINKVEAASPSVFVSGARPYIVWGCGTALLYAALFEPFMRFIAMVIFHYTGSFPVIDTTLTTQVLLGVLGLGGLRTYEKINGVASR
jgi:hypothetical protein